MSKSPDHRTRSFTTVFLIEMWERFGFYGMQALIVYFMVQHLGFPDDRANLVWGAAAATVALSSGPGARSVLTRSTPAACGAGRGACAA